MELNEFDSALVLLFHHGICQTLCGESLANTRCALQNNIFLVLQHRDQCVIFAFRHIDFIQESRFIIGINLLWCRQGIFLTDHIDDKIIFTLCQSKQTALLHTEVFHLRKLRAFFECCEVNWRRKALDLFKVNFFSILFCAYSTNCNNLLNRGRFISDDHIAGARIQEILENSSLIAVFVIEGIRLNISNSQRRKAPYLGVRI